MNTIRISKILCAFTVTGMLLGSSSLVWAGDGCKNVKFKVKNNRDRQIKITKVEYYNADNNKTQSENITPNLICNSDATCSTNGDKLRDSEGVNLTNFVFFFKDAATQQIGLDVDVGHQRKWEKYDVHTQPKVPVNKKCKADRTYSGDPIWTINN